MAYVFTFAVYSFFIVSTSGTLPFHSVWVFPTFFLFFAVNMSMVMGLAPVVGVPLPMVSYGGSAMLVLMVAFGIVQSAHVHRPRRKS